MPLSGFLSSSIAQRFINSGQALSQLACVLSPQETQWSLSLLAQALVRCFPPQVPQVSSASGQLAAKCPQRLHFMHCAGSCFCFEGWIILLQMTIPSLISLFAASTEEIVMMAKARVCSGLLRLAGLIHLALRITLVGRLLTSSTSLRCVSLSGSKVSGTLGRTRLYSRSLM